MPLRPPKKLGELLLDRGLVSAEQIAEAVVIQQQYGKLLGQVLLEKGWLSERQMTEVLSEQFSIPCVWLRPGLYDPAAVALVDKHVLQRLDILPLVKMRDTLTVATADPQAIPKFDELEQHTGLRIRVVLAPLTEIKKHLAEASSGFGVITDYVDDLSDDFQVVESRIPEDYTEIDHLAEGSPVINLVNSIIQRAVHDGASDVHIEPSRAKCRVRMRIDGVLYEVMTPKIEMHSALVSRLKVMAGLDIAERRMPQDGRIQVHTQGRTVDLRFSSLPGICGEKIVLRVLDKNQSILDLDRLGMTATNLAKLKGLLTRSNGLFLATGPTGSGKSTTLYAAINHLNSLEKNIVTIEDPVEYQIDIINQNQVRESIGLTFAVLLKHVLRQDPDIVMVGEIRERETAEITVQAALTGHLVLSTLHTNDAVGAVVRLLDMGIEPYLLSSSLIGVVGQRLVRTICPACKTSFLPDRELALRLGLDPAKNVRLARGRGCPACYDSGYKGRIGIHEVLVTDSALQSLMNASPSREEIEAYIKHNGLQTLTDDGFQRVIMGQTTIEEIARSVNVI